MGEFLGRLSGDRRERDPRRSLPTLPDRVDLLVSRDRFARRLGAIRDKWGSLGWENSPLGFPVTDEYAIPGGARSDFQGGCITWTPSTGAVVGCTARPDNPGNSKDCGDFPVWRQAQDWFEYYHPHYGDVANLDGDDDLIACERLPGAP